MESWVPSMWWGIFHETRDLPEALVQGKELLYLTWFFKNLAFPAAVYLETSSKVLPSEIFLLFLSPFLSSMSNPNGLISMKKSLHIIHLQLHRISMNLLVIILLQAQCVPDLSIIGLFHRMQLKIKIIQRLNLQCQYWW